MQPIPDEADVVVVGGGSAGAVIAGRLAEGSDRSVLLLEAGPDYGSFAAGGWPQELLDARRIPWLSHSWNYTSAARYGQPGLRLDRARVIGGCSSHNGCLAVWGHRDDYDGWARLGNAGWGTDELLPLLREANRRLRVRYLGREEYGPFLEATLEAAPAAGLPLVQDLNDVDMSVGMAFAPMNVVDGVRWNAAFAYLDPARDRRNLAVRGNVLADRLVVERGRVIGVDVIGPEGRQRVRAGEVVVSAGTYGSPALLLRSGVGAPEPLAALGIQPVHTLRGVGENLHDHPEFIVPYAGTEEAIAQLSAFIERAPLQQEGTIGRARSARCQVGYDLHICPVGSPYGWWAKPGWFFGIAACNMTPRSRGALRLASPDPEVPPIMDHGYLTDADDHDLAVLLDGIEIVRSLAAQPPLAGLLGGETGPSLDLDRQTLRAVVRANCVHYYHPVGTCRMGPASDPLAVVDARGRVHGLDGVRVADASIMPVVPRANTNLPAIVVGEKIAAALLEDIGQLTAAAVVGTKAP